MQDGNTDERNGRPVNHRGILVVKAHVSELPQHQSNQGGGATSHHHGDRRSDDEPLVGRQVAEQPHHVGIAENRNVLHRLLFRLSKGYSS